MKKGKNVSVMVLTLIVCVGMLGMVGMAKDISFGSSNTQVRVGNTCSVDVSLSYTPLNTTTNMTDNGSYTNETNDLIYMSDTNIQDITDFDFDTYMTMTGDEYVLSVNVMTLHFRDGLTSFDGVWAKKSYGLGIYEIVVQNNTYGIASNGVVTDKDGLVSFPYGSNLSYKDVTGVYVGEGGSNKNGVGINVFGQYTFAEYCDLYGSIDNVTVIFSSADFGIDLNLYEFHLFNHVSFINGVYVVDSAGNDIAWGITGYDIKASDGKYTLVVNVPKTAVIGDYFLWVEDNHYNDESTTITVLSSQTNTMVWAYPFVAFLVGAGLFATADYFADVKKFRGMTVVILMIGGAISWLIAGLMTADVLGYTHIGIIPNYVINFCHSIKMVFVR